MVLGPCQVCARGAIFLAKAVRFDAVKVSQMNDYGRNNEMMSDFFAADQLRDIEVWFEGWYGNSGGKAHLFYLKYPDAKKRLTLILKNIIKNQGTFVPSQLQ